MGRQHLRHHEKKGKPCTPSKVLSPGKKRIPPTFIYRSAGACALKNSIAYSCTCIVYYTQVDNLPPSNNLMRRPLETDSMWNLTVVRVLRGGSIRLFGSGQRSPIEILRVAGLILQGLGQALDSGWDVSSPQSAVRCDRTTSLYHPPSERPAGGELCRPNSTFLDWLLYPTTQAVRRMLP